MVQNEVEKWQSWRESEFISAFLSECYFLEDSDTLLTTWTSGDWKVEYDENDWNSFKITCSRYSSVLEVYFGNYYNDYWDKVYCYMT